MLRSMTGYGQASLGTEEFEVAVEMRSVNHRFLEISVRMPRECLALEEGIKKLAGRYIKRGKVDLFINIENRNGKQSSLDINWGLAEAYYQAHQALKDRFAFDDASLRPMELLAFEDVVRIEDGKRDIEKYREPMLESVELACQQLIHMRKSEGRNLQEDLAARIAKIADATREVGQRAPLVAGQYRERLLHRMKDLLAGNWDGDESRILAEVAIFSEKANIDEELTRLASHCQQFLAAMDADEPVGRKLDFLVQEMNREANTIGSKANDLEIGKKVVDMKAELEKIKEQVQNIE